MYQYEPDRVLLWERADPADDSSIPLESAVIAHQEAADSIYCNAASGRRPRQVHDPLNLFSYYFLLHARDCWAAAAACCAFKCACS